MGNQPAEIGGVFDYEKERNAFAAFYENVLRANRPILMRNKKDIEERLADTKRAIERLRSKQPSKKIRKLIGGFQRREKAYSGELRRAYADLEALTLVREKALSMYDSLLAVPRVKVVRVSNFRPTATIVIETEVLYGKHGGAWFRFQEVVIHVNVPVTEGSLLERGRVLIKYFAATPTSSDMITPQVAHNHAPCLGDDAARTISEAAKIHDYATIVNVAVRFAECFGNRRPTENGWPAVASRDVPEWYRQHFGA